MDQRPPSPDDGRASPSNAVVPWTRPEPPAIGLTGFLRRATDLGLGAASIAASAAVDAIERFVPGEPSDSGDGIAQPGVVRLVPGALMGAGLVAQRRMLDVSARVERGLAQVAGTLARAPFVGAPVRATEGYLERWSDVGEVEQARNRALVAEFVRRLAPELATAVIAQLDMDALMGQLPIDAIVARVDIDALLDKVNVEGHHRPGGCRADHRAGGRGEDHRAGRRQRDRRPGRRAGDHGRRSTSRRWPRRSSPRSTSGRSCASPPDRSPVTRSTGAGSPRCASTGSSTGSPTGSCFRHKARNLVVPGYDPTADPLGDALTDEESSA